MRVGVEVGGTFTDLVAVDGGKVVVTKVPSTPRSPDIGAFEALTASGIDLSRVEEERARECLGQYEAFLKRLGLLTDEHAAAVRSEAEALMRAGIAAAEAEAPADPSLLFDYAYVDPPPNVRNG